MSAERKFLLLALWTGAGFFLIWILFKVLSISISDAVAALASVPFWLIAAVAALTLANQIIGTLKWRASANYLAEPTDDPGILRLIELTSLGALFGQFVPIQVSTIIARWFLLDKGTRESGYAFRATFFEQTFDLVLLFVGSLVALAVLGLNLSPAPALTTLVCISIVIVLGIRPILRFAAVAVSAGSRIALIGPLFQAVLPGLKKASVAPTSLMLTLSTYSLVRLIVVGLRAVIVFAVLVPEARNWLVFLTSPAIGLLSALPISPGGLGVAEWSWSAVLVVGGSAAATAAVGALNLRLINFVALFVIVFGLAVARRIYAVSANLEWP